MFIGQATKDLKDIQVCDKVMSFEKDHRFFARDGVLYEQIQAGNIKVVIESSKVKNEDLKDFVVFETESNKNEIEALIKAGDTNAYKDMRTQVNSFKEENERLKKELEELKKAAHTLEDETKKKKGK